ncbi:MAG: LAGLIDADG family homing endonuclease [Candidatus Moranbacteria bacterium]|nr:LAGLIDADG family homing endonuclease [Candidatus Moranbacteria bacterium]
MRMMKKVDTHWSPSLAYIIGIIATDGNLSSDQRHITITSKDEDILILIRDSLKLTSKVGKKSRGASQEKKYSVLQIGDKNFYNFLLSIGLTPNKSKTIGKLLVPQQYFSHFLRGCIDGDGSIGSVSHPESKHQQLRIRLYSASALFLLWIKKELDQQLSLPGGWIYTSPDKSLGALSYGKADSTKILHFIYKNKGILYLKRKLDTAAVFMGK